MTEDIFEPDEKQKLDAKKIVEKFRKAEKAYQEKIAKEFKPEKSNVWLFKYCDKRFGIDYPGRVPGQYIQNLLWWLEHKRKAKISLIIDPMAGGGTTQDVVEWWNKEYGTNIKCLSYDIKPARDFIKANDVTKGLPEEAKGCDLIFLDPPYYRIKDYGRQFKTFDEFHAFIRKVAEVCLETLKEEGYVAILMQNFMEERTSDKCADSFEATGFKYIHRFQVPYLTTKGQEKRDYKRLDRDLYIFQKPKGVKPKPEIPEDLKVKLEELLTQQDPLEFIADTVELLHYGKSDRDLSKILWLASLSTGAPYGLFIIAVGKSGVGKSDLMYAVLLTIPNEYVATPDEISPKAIYFAVKEGKDIDKCVIYFDDVRNLTAYIEMLKRLASENRRNPEYWSVDEMKYLRVILEGRWVVFASTIESISDRQRQLLRRYIVINPSESEVELKNVVEQIKQATRKGLSKRGIPKEYEQNFTLAQILTKTIKDTDLRGEIPFDFDYPIRGTETKTEVQQFSALIHSIAKARFRQRVTISLPGKGETILAQPEDFDTAVKLWRKIQPLKMDETSLKILKELTTVEPKQLDPEAFTVSAISSLIGLSTNTVNQALDRLHEIGYVNRKPIGGRGNPYAYWKTEEANLSFEEPLIKLRDLKSSFRTWHKETIGDKPTPETRAYVERIINYMKTKKLRAS